MAIRISSALIADLLKEAELAAPNECCGLLSGTRDDHIETITRSPNLAHDPLRHFEIDPAILIAAERAHRSGGDRLIGYYHAHPNGRREPSLTDAKMAAHDGRLWLVIANGDVSAWFNVREGTLHGAFERVELDIR